MREKLLKYLYSAFDKDPQKVLAFRVSHVGTAVWTVKDRVLTITTKTFGIKSTVSLRGKLISQVVTELRNYGYTVTVNSALQNFNAGILIDDSGDEANEYNGNAVYAFSSPLWAIIDTLSFELEVISDDIVEALKMIFLHQAEGFWLDVWGSYFGIEREQNQSDEDYLTFIIEEITRLRNNHYAMRNAVEKLTGIKVFIHEFWKDATNDYTPSGVSADDTSAFDICINADTDAYCRFEVIVEEELTEKQKESVLKVIEATRPIGVLCDGIVTAPFFFGRGYINYEPFLTQTYTYATWNINHDWKDALDGNDATWTEQIWSGFSVSMAFNE